MSPLILFYRLSPPCSDVQVIFSHRVNPLCRKMYINPCEACKVLLAIQPQKGGWVDTATNMQKATIYCLLSIVVVTVVFHTFSTCMVDLLYISMGKLTTKMSVQMKPRCQFKTNQRSDRRQIFRAEFWAECYIDNIKTYIEGVYRKETG